MIFLKKIHEYNLAFFLLLNNKAVVTHSPIPNVPKIGGGPQIYEPYSTRGADYKLNTHSTRAWSDG